MRQARDRQTVATFVTSSYFGNLMRQARDRQTLATFVTSSYLGNLMRQARDRQTLATESSTSRSSAMSIGHHPVGAGFKPALPLALERHRCFGGGFWSHSRHSDAEPALVGTGVGIQAMGPHLQRGICSDLMDTRPVHPE